MTEYIEINILSQECFICFDEIHDDDNTSDITDRTEIHKSNEQYIELQCCHSSNIHKLCLFKIFLSFYNKHDSVVSCPLCRTTLSPIDYFTLEDILVNFSKLDIVMREKYIQNINLLLISNYLKEDQIIIQNKTNYTEPKHSKYTRIILIVVLALIMIGIFATHFF